MLGFSVRPRATQGRPRWSTWKKHALGLGVRACQPSRPKTGGSLRMAKTLLMQIGFQPALPRHSREACPPGERESTTQASGNASLMDWVPACAGMTMARECGHQVRNRGSLPLRDIKNEDRSGDVYENKCHMTICHAVLQPGLRFCAAIRGEITVFRQKKRDLWDLKARKRWQQAWREAVWKICGLS
jgi:hypothetical protein